MTENPQLKEQHALTFKQYLESKEKLREALKQIPQRIQEYSVNKYCKLPVGSSKNEKTYVSLKPKHKIIVEWLYEDIDNPTPVSLTFQGLKESFPKLSTFWDGEKLTKWLKKNSREVISSILEK